MKNIVSIAAIMAVLAFGASAHAGNLVANGGFESTTNGPGLINYDTTLKGWTMPSGGYTFVGTAAQFIAGVPDGEFSTANSPVTLSLWSQANGGLDTLAASPTGGNFIGQDGAWEDQPVQQTINGLTVGKQYTVGFYWAGAQQTGYYSQTTESWQVSLGGDTQSTAILSNMSEGFTGWQHDEFVFTANSASEVLSFLAVGTPTGQPPFSLLDGVTLYQGAGVVPEPAVWAMMILGVAGVGAVARRRRARALSAVVLQGSDDAGRVASSC
jgi:hypothetical protein